MIRIFSTIPLLLCASLIYSQQDVQTVTSKATAVVLYPQGAQVTRTAKAELKKGKNNITISGLSPFLNASSLQVYGNGNFTIASVSSKYNFLEEDQKKNQLVALQSRIDSLQNELDIQNAYLTVSVQEENMLIDNQSIGGANTGVKTIDLKEAIEFQRQKMTEAELEQVKINKKIDALTEMKEKLDKQAANVKSLSAKTSSDVIVTINSEEALKTDLKISYFVTQAKWLPYYDVRVKDINSPIDFSYKAKISQSTGEEWKDVLLTLSTSDPQSGAQKPYLKKWELKLNDYRKMTYKSDISSITSLPQYNLVQGKVIDASSNEPLIGVNVVAKGTTVGTVTDIDGNYSLSIPNGSKMLVFNFVGYEEVERPIIGNSMNIYLNAQQNELDEITVSSNMSAKRRFSSDGYKKSQLGFSNPVITEESVTPVDVNFNIKTPYTILSDDKINSVDIQSFEIPATYQYYAAPKLDKSAFLTALITDWSDLNLLPGEANLYFENTYVGKSVINPDITEDTLEISLGRDKNIVVKRELVKDFSKKQLLGGNKVVNKAWEISVKNNRKLPVQMLIEDQFPISSEKEVTVEQIEKSNGVLDEETGIVKWKFSVEPSAEKKVILKYSVKYPKGDYLRLE